MKTNEEILQPYIVDYGKRDYTWEMISPENAILAMKEAQKEIVEYILERAANEADFDTMTYISLQEGAHVAIDKESITSLKDEIIKEIENGTIK